MICRLWRGWTTNENADAYERIVRGEVIRRSKHGGFPASGAST